MESSLQKLRLSQSRPQSLPPSSLAMQLFKRITSRTKQVHRNYSPEEELHYQKQLDRSDRIHHLKHRPQSTTLVIQPRSYSRIYPDRQTTNLIIRPVSSIDRNRQINSSDYLTYLSRNDSFVQSSTLHNPTNKPRYNFVYPQHIPLPNHLFDNGQVLQHQAQYQATHNLSLQVDKIDSHSPQLLNSVSNTYRPDSRLNSARSQLQPKLYLTPLTPPPSASLYYQKKVEDNGIQYSSSKSERLLGNVRRGSSFTVAAAAKEQSISALYSECLGDLEQIWKAGSSIQIQQNVELQLRQLIARNSTQKQTIDGYLKEYKGVSERIDILATKKDQFKQQNVNQEQETSKQLYNFSKDNFNAFNEQQMRNPREQSLRSNSSNKLKEHSIPCKQIKSNSYTFPRQVVASTFNLCREYRSLTPDEQKDTKTQRIQQVERITQKQMTGMSKNTLAQFKRETFIPYKRSISDSNHRQGLSMKEINLGEQLKEKLDKSFENAESGKIIKSDFTNYASFGQISCLLNQQGQKNIQQKDQSCRYLLKCNFKAAQQLEEQKKKLSNGFTNILFHPQTKYAGYNENCPPGNVHQGNIQRRLRRIKFMKNQMTQEFQNSSQSHTLLLSPTESRS